MYILLADIVHMNYPDDRHAIEEVIPAQIKSILELFEALPLESAMKESMRDSVMSYIYLAKKEFEAFNEKADYSDKAFLPIVVHRFQVDAERTRIFLELRERDWEADIPFLEMDF